MHHRFQLEWEFAGMAEYIVDLFVTYFQAFFPSLIPSAIVLLMLN